MELGNEISKRRKEAKLSQEQLAEKLNVTRQTISNWELGQTVPDINQAKELSKIFNISLDELADNNVKDILIEKINKTEKKTGEIQKVLKVFFIAIIIIFIIIIIINLFYIIKRCRDTNLEKKSQILYEKYINNIKVKKFNCKIQNQEYIFTIFYDNDFNTIGTNLNLVSEDEDAKKEFESLVNDINIEQKDARNIIENLKEYLNNKNGTFEEILQ